MNTKHILLTVVFFFLGILVLLFLQFSHSTSEGQLVGHDGDIVDDRVDDYEEVNHGDATDMETNTIATSQVIPKPALVKPNCEPINPYLHTAEQAGCLGPYIEWQISEFGSSRYAYYPEAVIVRGQYRKTLVPDDYDMWYASDQIHFVVDSLDIDKLPMGNYTQGQVNFRFFELVESAFGLNQVEQIVVEGGSVCTINGEATVLLSEIIVNTSDVGIPMNMRMVATLDHVVESEPYQVDCRQLGAG